MRLAAAEINSLRANHHDSVAFFIEGFECVK
jgi:hypothetical protein